MYFWVYLVTLRGQLWGDRFPTCMSPYLVPNVIGTHLRVAPVGLTGRFLTIDAQYCGCKGFVPAYFDPNNVTWILHLYFNAICWVASVYLKNFGVTCQCINIHFADRYFGFIQQNSIKWSSVCMTSVYFSAAVYHLNTCSFHEIVHPQYGFVFQWDISKYARKYDVWTNTFISVPLRK